MHFVVVILNNCITTHGVKNVKLFAGIHWYKMFPSFGVGNLLLTFPSTFDKPVYPFHFFITLQHLIFSLKKHQIHYAKHQTILRPNILIIIQFSTYLYYLHNFNRNYSCNYYGVMVTRLANFHFCIPVYPEEGRMAGMSAGAWCCLHLSITEVSNDEG